MKKKEKILIILSLSLIFIISWGLKIKIIKETILVATGGSLISIFLGTIIGFLIKRKYLLFFNKLKYSFLLPLLIPTYTQAINWMDFFHRHNMIGTSWIFGISYFPIVTILFLIFKKTNLYFVFSFLFIFMLIFSDPITPEITKIDTYPAYAINQFVFLKNISKALRISLIPFLLTIIIGVIFAVQFKNIEFEKSIVKKLEKFKKYSVHYYLL